ncbi:PAS domain-containing protein [Pedobacter sp.]|uniref:PAS domain-containing protein n=1 Tax=Pedobacter sp. TaxID=1411316 RepID=UPI003D7FB872
MSKALETAIVKEFCQLRLGEDEELHEAVLLATKIFDTPIASLCLCNKDELSVELSVGVTSKSFPGVISLCKYARPQKDISIIEDTLNSDLFSPLGHLENETPVRFLAVAPLITKEGLFIGSLCVMDYVPHRKCQQDELSFTILAKHVVNIMEAKLNLRKLDQSILELERARETAISNEIKLRALFESLTDVYVFLSMGGEILDFNQAAYDYILKFRGKKMKRGSYTAHYLNEIDNDAFMANFRSALKGERISQEMLSFPEVAERVWWDSIFEPVRNKNGELMGVSYIARNINKRKMDSERILKQNKILKKIAHIHAHEYRGPVCSILGIMDLIESDQYVTSKEYLLMLQKAVKKLDEKTHTVISLISDLNKVSEPGSFYENH